MTNSMLSTKLASALLLHKGELSMKDIRSLPTVNDDDEVALITSWLLANFEADIYQKKISSSPLPEWEEIIRLKKIATSL